MRQRALVTRRHLYSRRAVLQVWPVTRERRRGERRHAGGRALHEIKGCARAWGTSTRGSGMQYDCHSSALMSLRSAGESAVVITVNVVQGLPLIQTQSVLKTRTLEKGWGFFPGAGADGPVQPEGYRANHY